MDKIVSDKRDEIAQVCEKYKVKRLDVLGPVRVGWIGKDTKHVDFLVDFADPDPHIGGFKSLYWNLSTALGDLFEGELDHVFLTTANTPQKPGVEMYIKKVRESVYANGD